MSEINLLENYPRSKRDINGRVSKKTNTIRKIARRFGREFFDGDRAYGYGGYHYHPRFWQRVIPDFIKYYKLNAKSSILDVGCGKGFMLYDFYKLIPGIKMAGLDISSYAINNAIEEIKPFLVIGNAAKLPYADKSFDLVISINTVHNLPLSQCKAAIKEIQRVTKKYAFITVDAYRNKEEKKRMFDWNLTAKTILSKDEWIKLFSEIGYKGDYYWFTP